MQVGENVTVMATIYEDGTATPKKRQVDAVAVYVHPEGRFITVRLPCGYCETIYPKRRPQQREAQNRSRKY